MGRRCRGCRQEIVDRERPRDFPVWARGPEFKGWQWKPSDGVIVRFTETRSMEIDEDGDLVLDCYGNNDWEPDMVEFVTPLIAAKIANLIAEADGGWSPPLEGEDSLLVSAPEPSDDQEEPPTTTQPKESGLREAKAEVSK